MDHSKSSWLRPRLRWLRRFEGSYEPIWQAAARINVISVHRGFSHHRACNGDRVVRRGAAAVKSKGDAFGPQILAIQILFVIVIGVSAASLKIVDPARSVVSREVV